MPKYKKFFVTFALHLRFYLLSSWLFITPITMYIYYVFIICHQMNMHGTQILVILQVTFVFTNQVDGKLVPIESKVSLKMQATEGNNNRNNHITNLKPKMDQKSKLLSQHHELLKYVPSLENSAKFSFSASSQPKSMRTSLKGTIKPKLSFGNQLPLKRLSSDNVEHDDDFE